jgi:hypothetical protein
MDPLSISVGVAGFLSLAMEISKILAAYVGDVKSAPEEAHSLLTEVSSQEIEIASSCLGLESEKKYTLWQYATNSWVYHARNAKSPNHAIEEVIVNLLREKYHSHSGFRCILSWPLFFYWKASWKTLLFVDYERKSFFQDFQIDGARRHTLLHIIATIGLEKVLSEFIDSHAAEIDEKEGYNGRTPLSIAAQQGYEDLVSLFSEKEGVDVNAVHRNNNTPLSWAVRGGHVQVVKLLLEKDNIDLNLMDLKTGCTPLAWAVDMGHTEVVKLLLENDSVEVDSKGCGKSPLALAAQKGHKNILVIIEEI